MNVDLGIWGKLTRLVMFLLVVAGVLGVLVWYHPLLRRNEKMRTTILALETQIKQQEDEARRLDGAIRALRNDPRTLERTAREKLGFARPGETVIRFE